MVNWLSAYFSSFPVAATVQLIAFPFYLLSFWLKKKAFLILTVITSILYAIGYLYMDAWSGLTLALMSALSCVIVFNLDRLTNVSEYSLQKTRWVLLALFGISNIVICLVCEIKTFAVLIVVASLLNYYNYFLMENNNNKTKFIFIASHVLIVAYEIIIQLYIFATMDFLITLSICGALIKAVCSNQNQCAVSDRRLAYIEVSKEEYYVK